MAPRRKRDEHSNVAKPRKPNGDEPFLTHPFRFFETVEEACDIGTLQRGHAVWLAFLDRVARDSAPGAQELRFLLHLAVPPIFVQLADVHEYAELRDRL